MNYQNDDHRLICLLGPELAPSKIGRKFGISTDSVNRILGLYGVASIDRRKNRDSKAKKILQLDAAGYKTQQICNLVGCDYNHIRKVLWDAGIGAKKQIENNEVAIKKVAVVERLRNDGMVARDACRIVGIEPSQYYKRRKQIENKKAAGV